jgi:hypothetical protein
MSVLAGSATQHSSAHLSIAAGLGARLSWINVGRMPARGASALTLIWIGLIITPLWAAALGALVWSLVP